MKYMNYKKRRNLVTFTILFCFSVFFGSCNDEKKYGVLNDEHILTDIEFNVTNPLPLLIGTDSLISYTLSPEYATQRELIWTSADTDIATVDIEGRIYVHKVGKVNITARSAVGFVANSILRIEVVNEIIKVQSLSITSATGKMELYETSSLALTAVTTPSEVTYPTMKWTSGNADIATVSANGVVTGLKPGKAVITATATDGSNVTTSVELTVKKIIPVEDIILENEEDGILSLYEMSALNIKVIPEDATSTALKWYSANSEIVSIEELTGIFTVNAYGTTTLTAKSDNIERSFEVTVTEGKFNDIFEYSQSKWGIFAGNGTKMIVQDGKLKITTKNNNGTCVSEINRGKTDFHAGKYPIVAVKVYLPGVLNENYLPTLNVWTSGSGHGVYKGLDTLQMPDGSYVYYADISINGKGFAGGKTMSSTEKTTLNNFIYEFRGLK